MAISFGFAFETKSYFASFNVDMNLNVIKVTIDSCLELALLVLNFVKFKLKLLCQITFAIY